ncbi:CAAX prenyl protease [Rhizina undulata]
MVSPSSDTLSTPRFTTFHASLFSVIYTISYVGVLYISPLSRPSPNLPRDTPSVIRIRIRAVTIVSILCLLLTSVIDHLTTTSSWKETASRLGCWPVTPRTILDILRSLLLVAVLFAGPLLERLCFEGGWRGLPEQAYYMLKSWMGWRNFVAAPFTEEIVFRACMVPLQLIGGRSPPATVFLTPLYFGIAHIHHAYEFYLNNPGEFAIMIVRSLIQFSYTTLFGWFATFVFLRTGSIWTVICVHSFCNMMGVPNVAPVRGPKWKSVVYYSLLVSGAWGFYKLLFTLTESSNALAKF